MTDKQPEALRLADALHKRIALRYMGNCKCGSCQLVNADDVQDAAAELRRLHEVNADLIDALQFCSGTSYISDAHEVAEEALAKVEGR